MSGAILFSRTSEVEGVPPATSAKNANLKDETSSYSSRIS